MLFNWETFLQVFRLAFFFLYLCCLWCLASGYFHLLSIFAHQVFRAQVTFTTIYRYNPQYRYWYFSFILLPSVLNRYRTDTATRTGTAVRNRTQEASFLPPSSSPSRVHREPLALRPPAPDWIERARGTRER